MKKYCVTINLVLLCLSASAQKNNYYTELQPVGNTSHYVNSFAPIGDTGYVACSRSSGYSAGEDVLVITTDKDGLENWIINYDFGGEEDAQDIINTSDGGFLFCGSTGAGIFSPTDALVVKTDASGAIQWSKKSANPSTTVYSIAYAVLENSNGTFTVLGVADHNVATDNDLFLWKLDTNGDTIWTTTFVNTGNENPYRLIDHSNGDYTILSERVSPGGVLAPYIMHVSSTGSKLWSKVYDVGVDFGPRGITESADGGYMVVGFIRRQLTPSIDADAAIMKLDSSGNVSWIKTHGKYMPNDASAEYGIAITSTFDGGYAIAGLTNAYSGGSGFQDVYHYKLDSLGNLMWTKLYGESDSTNNAAVDIYENSDSTLSMGGQHYTNPPVILGQTHTFILKTSYLGGIGCMEKDSLPDTTIAYTATVTTPSETIASYTATENITAVTTNETLTQVTTCITDTSTNNAVNSGICLVINEVALKPVGEGPAQNTREWIELYNPSCTDTADLTGWYIRSDINNDIFNPVYGDDMIVTWATRNPGTSPNDSSPGPLDTNTIMIPPKGFALIIDPTWNDTTAFGIDIPDSAIILTIANFLNFGSDGNNSSPVPPGPGNGLLKNQGDFVLLYDGDPNLPGANQIDSVGWFNNNSGAGHSLQRDNDCKTRWHYAGIATGGHPLDLDSSLTDSISMGVQNYLPNAPSPFVINSQDSSCLADSVAFSFADTFSCCTFTYLWNFDDLGSGASNTDTNISTTHSFSTAGIFNVSLIISDGCDPDTIYKTITILDLIVDLGNDISSCTADSIMLDAGNPGASYLWSTGETTQTIYAAGSGLFSVTVISSFGCQASDTINVSLGNITADAGSNTAICQGDSLTIGGSPTGPAGSTYSWNPASGLNDSLVANPVATPTTTTTYTVTVTNGTCTAQDSITISVISDTVDAGSALSLCLGANVLLGGSPTGPAGSTYSWSPTTGLDDSLSANPTAIPVSTTTYTVTVSTSCGVLSDSLTVTVNPLPVANAGNDITIFEGSSGELIGSGGPAYLWSPSAGLSCTSCQATLASPTVTTTYYLSVTDGNGCTSIDSVTVIVEPLVNVIFVPNVFSPNGDGFNDILDVQGSGYESLYFAVYDRWGIKVFESTSVDVDWDGTFKGKKLNSATFAYYMQLLYLDGTEYFEKGNIALIR